MTFVWLSLDTNHMHSVFPLFYFEVGYFCSQYSPATRIRKRERVRMRCEVVKLYLRLSRGGWRLTADVTALQRAWPRDPVRQCATQWMEQSSRDIDTMPQRWHDILDTAPLCLPRATVTSEPTAWEAFPESFLLRCTWTVQKKFLSIGVKLLLHPAMSLSFYSH